jgi:hypothetical protein
MIWFMNTALFTRFDASKPGARFPYLWISCWLLKGIELNKLKDSFSIVSSSPIQSVSNLKARSADLLLVEVIIGADLFGDADVLHVEDFGARELVGVLNGALADLLIADSHAYDVGHRLLVLR